MSLNVRHFPLLLVVKFISALTLQKIVIIASLALSYAKSIQSFVVVKAYYVVPIVCEFYVLIICIALVKMLFIVADSWQLLFVKRENINLLWNSLFPVLLSQTG